MNTWGTKKNLEQLVLKIEHINMNLKDLKIFIKPLRGISGLSDLKLDL